MSMPFYAPPEQVMKDRADYARTIYPPVAEIVQPRDEIPRKTFDDAIFEELLEAKYGLPRPNTKGRK